ncbi:MAG: 2'-5' RNA ligase [Desulfuromonadales bacterium C00003093]|nr:MAG: 2'-5' RNA ligase [Desulfuromonadales bacterium C00003093]
MTEPEQKRLRSFIAIPLPEPLRQELAVLSQQLSSRVPELKPANVENLHLTLNFLGDQTAQLLAKIGQSMLSIGRSKRIFNVTLKGLGFFPHRRRPRVLWIGLEPQRELIQLSRQLAKELELLGVQFDVRVSRPHLTIGRFKQQPKQLKLLSPFLSHSCGTLNVDRIILFSSELTPRGAIHTPLTTAYFTG